VSRSTASYKPEHHPVQSFPSHVITTPNGPERLQGESGAAARLDPVVVLPAPPELPTDLEIVQRIADMLLPGPGLSRVGATMGGGGVSKMPVRDRCP
jgi:hypothetical protein